MVPTDTSLPTHNPDSISNVLHASATIPLRPLTAPTPCSTLPHRTKKHDRNFAAAAAAALAFPTNVGGPKRRKTLAQIVQQEFGGGDDSGTEETGSNVDEFDRVQLDWAEPSTTPAVGGSGSGSGITGGGGKGKQQEYTGRPSYESSSGVPGQDIFDQEAGDPPPGPATGNPPFVLGRATYDFEPRDATERGYLKFKKGDLIVVTGMFSGRSSWWYGKKDDGSAGLFLAYHVQKVDLTEPVPPSSLKESQLLANRRLLSVADVSSLQTSRNIVNAPGPAVFRRYDFLTLHILLDYQRRLRAYELTLEGLFANPEKATNEEYRDLMASLEDTLTRYHDSLVRYRDIQSLELSSWTEANDFAHVVLPYVPKKQKTTVDAGDFVTPAGSGDSFTHVAKFLNLDAFLSRIILRFHGISTGSLTLKPLDARYRSSIQQTRVVFTRLLLSASGAILLVAPVIAMYFTNSNIQLGILCGVTFLTSILFSLSRTDPVNILIGSATVSAVLTVFLGSNGNGNSGSAGIR